MSIRSKVLAAVSALTLLGGVGVAGAVTAQASSTGCAFSNGCATLHGSDAAGNDVAMDAKHQNKTEILIGYPDNVGDNATSFDGDLHYGKGPKTTSYADTGLQISPGTLHDTCTNTPPALTVVSGVITAHGSDTLAVEDGVTGVTAAPSGNQITFTGSGTGTLVIDETYGPGCVAADSWGLTSSLPSGAATLDLNSISFSYPVDGIQFSGSNDTPVTFTYPNLPPGISSNPAGLLTTGSSVTPPGTYSQVGVSSADNFGAKSAYAFELVVSGIKSVTPGAGVPYYTFVYAPHGDWTSQCVTDINGSGALKLAPCTLGKDTGQDFTVGSSNGLLSGGQAHVSNLLAAAVGASSCLTDPSTSDAATPQSDAADEVAPGGRQLYVNGSCAAGANLWSWGT